MNKQWMDQYKDPRWQKKRLEIMERDGWSCEHCQSSEKMLSVHHQWYEKGKKIWDYPNKCFQTLCSDCHEYIHMVTSAILANVKKSFFASGWDIYSLDMLFSLVENNDKYSHKLRCSIQEISVERAEEVLKKRNI